MKKSNTLFIIMAVFSITILLGTGAYAYYRTTISGTTSGTIAKWSFTTNNQASTFSLDWGGLYPGKTDVKYLELSAEESELPVMFYTIFHFPNVIDTASGENDYEAYAEALASMSHYYFDSNYLYSPSTDSSIGFMGMIMPGEKMTVPIYYNWLYNGADNMDNQIAELAGGNKTTDKITIVARQMDKSTNESMEESLFNFLLEDFMNMDSCANGEYGYPNKYGYPCDTVIFEIKDEVIIIGDEVDYELADGNVVNTVKYVAQLIGFSS